MYSQRPQSAQAYNGYTPEVGAVAASYVPNIVPSHSAYGHYQPTPYQQQHDGTHYHPSGSYQPSSANYYHGNQQYPTNQSSMVMQAPSHTLLDWFNSVDTDRSGRIDASELSRALRKGGINLSVLGAAKIISMFDSNHSGQINFEEFQNLHPFIQKMTLTFKSRDKSGNGRIETSELRATLLDSGYSIDNATFGILVTKFDSEKKHSLGFEDYVQLIVFLHNVKETFQFYDRNRSGKVIFTTDSFLEASVSVRDY